MAETTKIEWCDATLNMWWGCTKVSPACRSCYAETLAHRWGKDAWGPGKPREDHRAGAAKLARKLNRQAEREGRRLRVFCLSMGDWLDPEVPAEWLADLLALVEECKDLDWLLLTKRPELWRERIDACMRPELRCGHLAQLWLNGTPPPNVWVGTTVEDQERADQRIPHLIDIPAKVRFLSVEPLLERISIERWFWLSGPSTAGPWRDARGRRRGGGGPGGQLLSSIPSGDIHLVIVGGESGRGARPMHPDWVREIREACKGGERSGWRDPGVAFFFKQWGDWLPVCPVYPEPGVDVDEDGCELDPRSMLDGYPDPIVLTREGATWDEQDGQPPGGHYLVRVGKVNAGRELDGRTWDELPA